MPRALIQILPCGQFASGARDGATITSPFQGFIDWEDSGDFRPRGVIGNGCINLAGLGVRDGGFSATGRDRHRFTSPFQGFLGWGTVGILGHGA